MENNMEFTQHIHTLRGEKLSAIANARAYRFKEVIFRDGNFVLEEVMNLAFVQDKDKMYAKIKVIPPPFDKDLCAHVLATVEIDIFDSPVSAFQQLAESLELV